MFTGRGRLAAASVAVVVAAASIAVWQLRASPTASRALPLTTVTALALPGDTSRFDYASLDRARHLLFIAHLGASQILVIDTAANRVVRVIEHLDGVHGVLVVPGLRRVYATATNTNQVITLDETTGTVLGRAPTGDYPDGLAYDSDHGRIWVTNESGGSETVLDTATGIVVGTVDVGGDAGNVAYDPAPRAAGSVTVHGRILVDVQSRDEVAVIDPTTLKVTRRIPVPGCDHPHGLALDPVHRLGFIACDGNATLHTLDLDALHTRDPIRVGADPDVLAFDPNAGWLYVAAESGVLTVLAERDRSLRLLGRDHLAYGAHVVAVDPATGKSYYPIPANATGQPELLIQQPAP